MIFYVGVGGMKGTTINQALELWIRFFAFVLMVAAAIYGGFHYQKILTAISEFSGTVFGTGAYTTDGKDIAFDGETWAKAGAFNPNFWHSASMLIGLSLGTLGLPHILLRFYTNPDAKAARKSAVMAIGIASLFFAFAIYLGVVGRAIFLDGNASPEVMQNLVTGGDNMVIPSIATALGGKWMLGFVIAGAFAAVFSNLSGLFIASSGAIAHDLYAKFSRKELSQKQRVFAAKLSIVFLGVFYGVLGLLVKEASIGHLVALAFTVGASTFAPIFILGIWWRGITEKGAIAGLIVGFAVSMFMIFFSSVLPEALQFRVPGIITVPIGFLTVYLVSIIDGKVPTDVNAFMRKVHASEESA